MSTETIFDVYLSVANYLESKKINSCYLTINDSIELFKQPYNMIGFNKQGESHGILVVYYEEQIYEQGPMLTSVLGCQYTWICIRSNMLKIAMPYLNERIGILTFESKGKSTNTFVIKRYRFASQQHPFPLPQQTVLELLIIQSDEFWGLENSAANKKKARKRDFL